jgi:hypothetical protein
LRFRIERFLDYKRLGAARFGYPDLTHARLASGL